MTRHDKLWIAAIWVGWLVLMTFVLAGCATTAYTNHKTAEAVGNVGPWTSFIAAKRNLSDCVEAEQTLDAAHNLDIKMQALLDDEEKPLSVISRQILLAEQLGIWQLENDLHYWINNNCAKV